MIKFAIIVLAAIGLIAIFQGKVELNFKNYTAPKREVLLDGAKSFADFSALDSDYKIGKTLNLFGFEKVTVTHTPSGQKTTFLHLKKSIKFADFGDKKIDKNIVDFYSKFEKTPISFQNVKITSRGTLIINKKEAKYVNFDADVNNLPYKKIKGTLGCYIRDNKTFVYICVRDTEKFSYKINSEILAKMKI